jgi:hypothetical protein
MTNESVIGTAVLCGVMSSNKSNFIKFLSHVDSTVVDRNDEKIDVVLKEPLKVSPGSNR